MHESAGDEPEEQDEGSGSASGGRSKPLRRPVAPQSSLGADSFPTVLETIPTDDRDDDQDKVDNHMKYEYKKQHILVVSEKSHQSLPQEATRNNRTEV